MRIHSLTMTGIGPYAGREHIDFDAVGNWAERRNLPYAGYTDLAQRAGTAFGVVFPVMAYLSIGAFYALPRTGAVSFETAVTPLFGFDSFGASAIFNVLFFGIALALVPLLAFTGNRALMGEMVNGPLVQNLGKLIVLVVVGLNGYLLIGSVL